MECASWFHNLIFVQHMSHYIDGLAQDCSNFCALVMELLQSCTKPAICDLCYKEFSMYTNSYDQEKMVTDHLIFTMGILILVRINFILKWPPGGAQKYRRYIPWNMHSFVVLYLVYNITLRRYAKFIYPHSSGLPHLHRGNHLIAPVPEMYPSRKWVMDHTENP